MAREDIYKEIEATLGGVGGFFDQMDMLDPNVKTTFPLSLGTTAQRRVALAERSPE